MADIDYFEKLLRSMLHSSKEGFSMSTLQSEYLSLCGESIPLKKLGYSKLEDYLRSIPSVVRLESRMGELRCFAVVCKTTAHIAELVARQKSSKKSGRSRIMKHYNNPVRKVMSCANGHKLKEKPPEQVWMNNNYEPGYYNVKLVRRRMSKLLEKYCSGLWMSRLSKLYSNMFSENLHPRALIDMENWTDICVVEKPSTTQQSDRLIYPPLPPEPSQRHLTPPSILNATSSPGPAHQSTLKQTSSSTSASFLRNPSAPPHSAPSVSLTKSAKTGFKVTQNSSTSFSNQNGLHSAFTSSAPAPQQGSTVQTGPKILPPLKGALNPSCSSTPHSAFRYSAPHVSAEVCERIKEILHRCGHGVWASALPRLYLDTYKMPFPEHVLDNLSLLLNICRVEYPLPHDKTKAILYSSPTNEKKEKQCTDQTLPSGLEVWGPVLPPCLVSPSVQYSSVLISDVKSSNSVTIRYVGEKYSDAQEAMEETMSSFYKHSSVRYLLSKAVVGQLVAVREEDGDVVTRAQVVEIISPDNVKVYYLDYGFFVETSQVNMLELHQNFLSLPFQATCVSLAGLQAFCSHPSVLSSLNKLVGKILLMETIEPREENKASVVVLYDTSQEDDININSTCVRALQDQNMNNPLIVKATYQNVCVTNVDPEGIIYCQLPSRGRARLCKLLEETEAIFSSQEKFPFLVSRPFSGKVCLAQYKGKWARVEITVTYASKVVEILFIDLGVPVTANVTDLREFPPALLPDFTIIPPQIIKCRLAELQLPEGRWSPRDVLLVKKAVLGAEDCKIMISDLEQQEGNCLVGVYLFIGTESLELDKSVNHQLAQSDSWSKTQRDAVNNTTFNPAVSVTDEPSFGAGVSSCLKVTTRPETFGLPTFSLLELPQPDQFMDVFVTLVHDPAHFVLQPWLDMHKLTILMGDMFLYYTRKWTGSGTICVQKGEVYAAKVGKKWCRVQVKEIRDTDSVCVYELDYGKTKIVGMNVFQPLVMDFRQLPFQAVVAQLAGVTQCHWSDEASLLFRKHVEHRALVAKVERVLDVKGNLWECRLSAYLVDTSLEDKDLWIHSLMADVRDEPFTA